MRRAQVVDMTASKEKRSQTVQKYHNKKDGLRVNNVIVVK